MTLFTRNRIATVLVVLVATGLLLGLSPAVGSEINIVGPLASLESEEGDFSVAGQVLQPLRIQYLYYASRFPSLPSGKMMISRISGRLDQQERSTSVQSNENVKITLATTDKTNLEQSDFDSNLEFGSTVVFDGSSTVTLPGDGPIRGPRPFSSGITLQTPYAYDPSDGKNLVVEYMTASGWDANQSLDWQSTGYVSTVFTRDLPSNTGEGSPITQVQQFTFIPEPSTAIMATLAAVGFVGFGRRRLEHAGP